MTTKRNTITHKPRTLKAGERHLSKIPLRGVLSNEDLTPPGPLVRELRVMIQEARGAVARTVDSGLVVVYWRIGDRIRCEILKEKRAEYGAQIVSALGRQLEAEFGRGKGLIASFACGCCHSVAINFFM